MKLYPGVIVLLCIAGVMLTLSGCKKSSADTETPSVNSSQPASSTSGSSTTTTSETQPTTAPTSEATSTQNQGQNSGAGGAGSTADFIKNNAQKPAAESEGEAAANPRIPTTAPAMKGSFPKPGGKF